MSGQEERVVKHPVSWGWFIVALVAVIGFFLGSWAWQTHPKQAKGEILSRGSDKGAAAKRVVSKS